MKPDTYRCTNRNCGWRGHKSEILIASHPFDPDEKVYGCPTCKDIECFIEICDDPECERDANCGWPSSAGYRRTCVQHMPEDAPKE